MPPLLRPRAALSLALAAIALVVPATAGAAPARAADGAPPTVRIRGPRATTPGSVSYRFFAQGEAGSGASFLCSLDGAILRPCPATYTTTLAIGVHVLRVRALDAVGEGPAKTIEIAVQVPLPPVQTPAITTIPVDAPGPDTFAMTSDAVWVGARLAPTVLRIDPAANDVGASIAVAGRVCTVASGMGAVYAAQCIHGDHSLSRIDPSTSAVTAENPAPRAGSVTTLDGSVWLTEYDLGQVWRLDPSTLEVEARIDVAPFPNPLVAAFGSVWSVSRTTCRVNRIDPATNTVIATVRLHAGLDDCEAVAATGNAIWATDDFTNRLYRIDPATGDVTTFEIGATDKGIWAEGSEAADADTLYVRTAPTQVSQIDPATGAVLARFEFGRNVMGLGLGFGSLWLGSPSFPPGPQAVLRMALAPVAARS
jgi:DNA-binding beta-propeller fold protein YncE